MELTNRGYRESIRYEIAKKKLEENFMKWISIPSTFSLIQKLIEDVKHGTASFPVPGFQPRNSTPASPSINSPQRSSLTPPLSPSAHDKFSASYSQSLPPDALQVSPTKRPSILPQTGANKPVIPEFYFPNGLPVDPEQSEKNAKVIHDSFPQDEITLADFHIVVSAVCELPKCCTQKLFNLIVENSDVISKSQFVRFWRMELEKKSPVARFFQVTKKRENNYLERDDFSFYMRSLLETHPGLEFLKATPEFQERYAETVIERIFYMVDANDDSKITFRELKRSNLLTIFLAVDEEEDINKIRDYFSYEHFYVLYCRFWELDTDHDFLIDKEDFSRYEGHSLSRKAIDRIFEQVPRQFKSNVEGKMGYDDFVWFMLSEEDKTTPRSLEYWFKVIDLDDNGIIT